jgi:hypothetical protein
MATVRKFRKQRIAVHLPKGGRREIDANVCGPLAVHRKQIDTGEARGLYVVTHVPTGMTVERRTMTKAHARRMAERLLVHADSAVWTDGEFAFAVMPPHAWLARAFAVLTAVREEEDSKSIPPEQEGITPVPEQPHL